MIKINFILQQLENFLPPDEELEPPHLCMILPSSRHQEVFELCNDYPRDILAVGFFKSENVNECKLICKTPEKFEQIKKKEGNEKIIMKVAKRTSHFALALTTLSPLYVSQNTSEGAEECAKIFNEHFYETEDVIEPSLEAAAHSQNVDYEEK